MDSHLHSWDLARRPQPWINPRTMPILDRSFPVPELEATLTSCGVAAGILVQILNAAPETYELLALAAASPRLVGVVGWVDLVASDVGAAIDELVAAVGGGLLMGVRHQTLAEVDPLTWLCRPEVGRGLAEVSRRGLVVDLLVAARHLRGLTEVVDNLDTAAVVLNHAGKPPIAAGWASADAAAWARDIAELARREHLACKLSGLTVLAVTGGRVDDLRPFVDHLMQVFGPARLMFGSDWPVSLRGSTYRQTFDLAVATVGPAGTGELAAVMGATARRIYTTNPPVMP